MKASIREIADLVGTASLLREDAEIAHLLTDSRRVSSPATSLFFAIPAHRRDGHDFIEELQSQGVRNFVISRPLDNYASFDANFIQVKDTLKALQEIAAWHRAKFNIPVIGITGSNGKTIVKEWLFQLLHEDYTIARSPKSYNSQIGVALSLWQLEKQHTLALIEAGISQPGEMEKLEAMIRPTIGVMTSFGEAHSAGFQSNQQKLTEKLKLFSRSAATVFQRETGQPLDICVLLERNSTQYHWSRVGKGWLTVKEINKRTNESIIDALCEGSSCRISIPFTDDASIANAITCWTVMLMLKIPQPVITERIKKLQPVLMRLELKKARNGCTLINDSYSTDLDSLSIALDFMEQQHNDLRKAVILSDFLQSAMSDDELYGEVFSRLRKHNISKLVCIGDRISGAARRHAGAVDPAELYLFDTVDSFLRQMRSSFFRDEIILVKGARIFEFERIVKVLELKTHQTVLEIDLNAIAHNLKQYQSRLQPGTRVMAMVKAFAYGSGGSEIAGILQYHKIDYLGVAYADEGVELRKAGIHVPVMVMNPEEISFPAITEHRLEPEIYSFALLEAWENFLGQEALEEYPIHIEIETGMNRLGFSVEEIPALVSFLEKSRCRVVSVFSHLAAGEEAAQDEFTRLQFERFLKAVSILESGLNYGFIKHIANSAAITRHSKMHLDMVRVGIGMYGVEQGTDQLDLQTVATLRSTIAQVKELGPGDSVSYNRRGIVQRRSRIATIRIGYADGYPRRLGNGKGHVWIRGKLAPLIGAVCMDMFMVDVTDIADVREGDDVVLFGRGLTIQELAKWAETIPYEIMTGISQRVKRVYFME